MVELLLNSRFFKHKKYRKEPGYSRVKVLQMDFINESITVLRTLVIALGGGLAVWGVINLLEGYGNDNPGAKSQGIKQLMSGGGIALVGVLLIPMLSTLFS